jgi:hypothetical protein
VSAVLIITYLYTQDCHNSVIQNSQEESEIYKPGKQHPLIYIKTVSTRDANRIPIKLKVVSGQYILQANRAREIVFPHQ